ncbi:ribosome maturation factor RimM [Pseudoclavibacter soli]|uniref:ribosome maturation factor RimM n=1 Tax=Pseudoclavibacter soli TaxID=452623 RepID=UPI0003FD27A5|nr:ribosome maturation factor RimM [Pseudoclavibacter soli]
MQLRIARLTKPHGLKGGLKIELYTDEPERRLVSGATFDLQVPETSDWHGRQLKLNELRWYNGHPVAFFEGIGDRTAAESVTKAILTIEHDETELPEEADAWYDHQLVGLTVVRDGQPVGEVVRVDHLPAQDVLALKTTDGAEVLLPFIGAFVPAVDIVKGEVTITPPGGLFEPADDGEQEADEVPEADLAEAETGLFVLEQKARREAKAAAAAASQTTEH